MNRKDLALNLSVTRRSVLTAAVAGAGLGLMPGARLLAAALPAPAVAPAISLGYLAPHAAAIVDAPFAATTRGSYQMSVIGAGVRSPFALAAQYSAVAEHRFWQAWIEQGMLQHSAPITIRWASNAVVLPVNVTLPTGKLTTDIAGRPGIYVLSMTPANQAVLPWRSLALAMQPGGESMKLVRSGSNTEVALNYVLFEVDRV